MYASSSIHRCAHPPTAIIDARDGKQPARSATAECGSSVDPPGGISVTSTSHEPA